VVPLSHLRRQNHYCVGSRNIEIPSSFFLTELRVYTQIGWLNVNGVEYNTIGTITVKRNEINNIYNPVIRRGQTKSKKTNARCHLYLPWAEKPRITNDNK
jgi:hypothetical protein